jgi:hypothetical protein
VGTRAERIVIAVPVAEEVVAHLREAEPDVDWAWEPELLPPRRFPGDYAGPSGFRRGPAPQERFEALVDGADALFGIPDTSPTALRRTALTNPALRWVHTMAAGGGAQLRAAELPPDRLATLAVTTSAGVHGHALAEFALLGVLAGLKDVPRWAADKDERTWPERAPVRQLRGATVLVLGTGGIGARVAEVFAACGAIVWGVTRHAAPTRPPFRRIVQASALADALPCVDALVCALPGTDATHHLVDKEVLSGLPAGAERRPRQRRRRAGAGRRSADRSDRLRCAGCVRDGAASDRQSAVERPAGAAEPAHSRAGPGRGAADRRSLP